MKRLKFRKAARLPLVSFFQQFCGSRQPPDLVRRKLNLTRLSGKCILWSLCFLPALVLHAQELPFTHYTTENEVNPLPSSGITTVYQDSLGYIWIAAYGTGLVRYDGYTLKSYGYEDSLKTSSVWALTEDRYGRLWVGSDDGLFVSAKPLQEYTDNDQVGFTATLGTVPLHGRSIQSKGSLVTDRRGWIWFIFRGGHLLRYRLNGPETIAADSISLPLDSNGARGRAATLISRQDGSVWVSLNDGRMMIIAGESTDYTILEEAPCSASSTLFESSSGILWGGCGNGWIWKLTEKDGDPHFTSFDPPYTGMVTAMLQDDEGKLWIAGLGGGLMHMQTDGADRVVYTRRHGLLDENIWDLMQDREGNYWIAQNSGLSKLRVDYEAFRYYTGKSHAGERPTLPAFDVDSVLPPFTISMSATGGTVTLLVAGTPAGAALIQNDGAIEHFTAAQGLPSDIVLNLCRDKAQGIWLGTRDGASRLTFENDAEALPGASHTQALSLFGKNAHLVHFAIDQVNSCHALNLPVTTGSDLSQEVVCFAGGYPVRCLVENRWFSFGTASGLPDDDYWALRADEQGYLYASTKMEGLYRSTLPLSIATLDTLSKRETLSTTFPALEITTPIFETVSVGPEQERIKGFSSMVWIGEVLWGVGEGLLALQGNPLGIAGRLDREHGFDANSESIAYAPQTKTLWIGTEKGLAEIDPDSRTVLRWLTKQDGLVGNVVWGPSAVAVGEDGTIYYATSTGLSLYLPHLDRKNRVAPTPRLRRVGFSEDQSGHNDLTLEYAALSFANEKQVRYKTRLQGFEDDWSSETTATSVRYTNLNAFLFPRIYTFEVIAANEDGLWSIPPLTYVLTVQPAWWLRWWAFLCYITLAATAALVVDRLQRRRLIHKERERSLFREKELRAETAEAWANYLQAENQRQNQELEQARQLQLSMLPKKVPDHPMVEIATFMKTATEVGGDYYDFYLADDGALTLTIGDATGHGLQAGTMVTAMKSLWNAFSPEPDLEEVLRKSGKVLKQMHLPKLYMALALARLRMPDLEFIGAGMPPALFYRALTREVMTIPLKGIPLGGPGELPYRRQSVTVSAGDTIVLMSDGFPELRSASGELFGYERMADVFTEVADQSSVAIISHLEEKIRKWSDGHSPDDDITFLVLKVREASGMAFV